MLLGYEQQVTSEVELEIGDLLYDGMQKPK
jgi:hypothetical protein